MLLQRYYWLLVISLVTGIYLLINFVLSKMSGNFFVTYITRPLLWLCLAFFILRLPRYRPAAKIRYRRLLNWLAFICAGFHILFLFICGVILGFGKSPYSSTMAGIITNIVFVGSSLAGMELSRAWLINYLSGRRPYLAVIVIGFFYTLLNLPPGKIMNLGSWLELTKFIGSFLFPTLSESVLTSYFAFLGGAVPALVYRGTVEAFQWFCPILPDLDWITRALLGTFIPVFSLILVQRLYLSETRQLRKAGTGKDSPLGWMITTTISVLLVWFSVGLFSVYPSVIVSGSMSPGIKKGDIVLVKRISASQASVGDIIQFRRGMVSITHRIIDVTVNEGMRTFRTKGDANEIPDHDPVLPEQVAGKVIFVVPKAGWIAIWIQTITGGISIARGENI